MSSYQNRPSGLIKSKVLSSMVKNVVHGAPELQGGVPVFVGPRVPVKNLFNYLEAGDSLEKFLEFFPLVSEEQIRAVLEMVWDND
jgi:uncharacterized protein (DUF433 family)